MKRIFLTALILLAFSSLARSEELVGSTKSWEYHWSSCSQARKIPKEDRIVFETPESARAIERAPCQECNPPKKSNPKEKESPLGQIFHHH